MRKFQQPRCPYCGKKISLPAAWILKSQGEFLCPQCGGISNVVLDRAVYLLAFLAVLVSAIFFIVSFLHLAAVNLWMVLLVLLPFFLFFLISVFLVRLRKPELHRKPVPPRPDPRQGPGAQQPRPAAPYHTVPGREPYPPRPRRDSPGEVGPRRDPTSRIPRR